MCRRHKDGTKQKKTNEQTAGSVCLFLDCLVILFCFVLHHVHMFGVFMCDCYFLICSAVPFKSLRLIELCCAVLFFVFNSMSVIMFVLAQLFCCFLLLIVPVFHNCFLIRGL